MFRSIQFPSSYPADLTEIRPTGSSDRLTSTCPVQLPSLFLVVACIARIERGGICLHFDLFFAITGSRISATSRLLGLPTRELEAPLLVVPVNSQRYALAVTPTSSPLSTTRAGRPPHHRESRQFAPDFSSLTVLSSESASPARCSA